MISWLFNECLAEILEAIQAFYDVCHAGRVAQSNVIVRAEGDAGHGGDFFLLQQSSAELSGLEAGLGNVRE